jgi:hypothetical protein
MDVVLIDIEPHIASIQDTDAQSRIHHIQDSLRQAFAEWLSFFMDVFYHKPHLLDNVCRVESWLCELEPLLKQYAPEAAYSLSVVQQHMDVLKKMPSSKLTLQRTYLGAQRASYEKHMLALDSLCRVYQVFCEVAHSKKRYNVPRLRTLDTVSQLEGEQLGLVMQRFDVMAKDACASAVDVMLRHLDSPAQPRSVQRELTHPPLQLASLLTPLTGRKNSAAMAFVETLNGASLIVTPGMVRPFIYTQGSVEGTTEYEPHSNQANLQPAIDKLKECVLETCRAADEAFWTEVSQIVRSWQFSGVGTLQNERDVVMALVAYYKARKSIPRTDDDAVTFLKRGCLAAIHSLRAQYEPVLDSFADVAAAIRIRLVLPTEAQLGLMQLPDLIDFVMTETDVCQKIVALSKSVIPQPPKKRRRGEGRLDFYS